MESVGDKPITMRELLNSTGGGGIPRSTLYRQMKQLVEEGQLLRHTADNGREYVYQLAKSDCSGHYHLKCTYCGKLVHLDDKITSVMQSRLIENNFEISERDTVLMGKCTDCKAHE